MKLPALIALTSLAACGGGDSPPVEPDAAAPILPRETVMEDKQILIGELVEGTLAGGPGDVVAISFDMPAAIDWNIHGHAGGGSQTVVEELDVTTVRYMFEPTEQADWSLLLRNSGSAPVTVQVKLELYGDMQWSGWGGH